MYVIYCVWCYSCITLSTIYASYAYTAYTAYNLILIISTFFNILAGNIYDCHPEIAIYTAPFMAIYNRIITPTFAKIHAKFQPLSLTLCALYDGQATAILITKYIHAPQMKKNITGKLNTQFDALSILTINTTPAIHSHVLHCLLCAHTFTFRNYSVQEISYTFTLSLCSGLLIIIPSLSITHQKQKLHGRIVSRIRSFTPFCRGFIFEFFTHHHNTSAGFSAMFTQLGYYVAPLREILCSILHEHLPLFPHSFFSGIFATWFSLCYGVVKAYAIFGAGTCHTPSAKHSPRPCLNISLHSKIQKIKSRGCEQLHSPSYVTMCNDKI